MPDTRAQSIQIGFIMLFGAFVIAWSVYAATIVPQQNEQVEFDHFEQVQDDMKSVRDAILTSGGSGTTTSESVSLGTSYPNRFLGLNPAPPSGRLRTAAEGQIQFDNLNIEGLCGYTGTARAFVYEPDYNELEAQTVGYDNTAVYLNDSGSYAILTEQSIIDGRTIELRPLNASFSAGGRQRQSITFKGGPANGTVKTFNSGLTLTLPSRLPASVWNSSDKLFGDTDAVTSVDPATNQDNAVNVTLEANTYTIACRAVGIDSFPASGEAQPGGIDQTGYGEGGEETYDPNDPDPESLATKGGKLAGIVNASSVVLEEPSFAMTKAGDSQVSNTDERHLQVGLKFQNESIGRGTYARYFFVIGEQDGLTYQLGPGKVNNVSWQQKDISLYRDTTGGETKKLFEDTLAASVLDTWLIDNEPINLLAEENYVSSATVRPDLEELESFLNNTEQTSMTVTDLHGRVTVNVSGEFTTSIGGAGGITADEVVYIGTSNSYLKTIDNSTNEVTVHDPSPTDGNSPSVGGFGPKVADLGAGDTGADIPIVGESNQYLRAVNENNQTTTLDATQIKSLPMGVGDWDEDGNQEVLYVTNNGNLKQYEPESGAASLVTDGGGDTIGSNKDVSAVAGVDDFTGDSNIEAVFIQNSKLKYITDDGTDPGWSKNVGISKAVSTLADFDDDGNTEVAVEDGNGNIDLWEADTNNPETTINPSGYDAAQAPMAGINWTGDSTPEIILLDGNSKVRYLNATDGTDTAVITDSTGTEVTADSNYGAQ